MTQRAEFEARAETMTNVKSAAWGSYNNVGVAVWSCTVDAKHLSAPVASRTPIVSEALAAARVAHRAAA